VFTIKKVTQASDGKVLYRAPRKGTRVLADDLDRDVSYALQQVVTNGTGQNAQALNRPAAGKTGTATNKDGDVSSSWFVGYTPQVATAVMYVRGKGNEALNGYLPSYFGADFPTFTWRAVMQGVLDGLPSEDFPPAAYVDGTAPQQGHAPYTPPPSPTQQPSPTKKSTPRPSKTPSPSRQPSPSQQPSPTQKPSPSPGPPSKTCDPRDPTCTR
jgi:membrane peptidoglycan carboxypeptidase